MVGNAHVATSSWKANYFQTFANLLIEKEILKSLWVPRAFSLDTNVSRNSLVVRWKLFTDVWLAWDHERSRAFLLTGKTIKEQVIQKTQSSSKVHDRKQRKEAAGAHVFGNARKMGRTVDLDDDVVGNGNIAAVEILFEKQQGSEESAKNEKKRATNQSAGI